MNSGFFLSTKEVTIQTLSGKLKIFYLLQKILTHKFQNFIPVRRRR